MALVAIRKNTDEEVESFTVPDATWRQMKKEPLGSYLIPDTNWPAVLKTSIRGTQFFAYAPGFTGIKPEPESEEHRVIKIALARALRAAGCSVNVEFPNPDKTGVAWKADVYCETPTKRIAFEVQLSNQTLEEYERRTSLYADSDIQAVWFVKNESALMKAIVNRRIKSGVKVKDLGISQTKSVAFIPITWPSKEAFEIGLVIGKFFLNSELCLQKAPVVELVKYIALERFQFEEVECVTFDGRACRNNRWNLSMTKHLLD